MIINKKTVFKNSDSEVDSYEDIRVTLKTETLGKLKNIQQRICRTSRVKFQYCATVNLFLINLVKTAAVPYTLNLVIND